VSLRCMAHLPPSFIDFIISRGLADGIFFAGCANGGCQYRLGTEWMEQRIARQRDPRLRERTDRNRLAMAWLQPWLGMGKPAQKLAAFRASLAGDDSIRGHVRASGRDWRSLPWRAAWYAVFMGVAVVFSAWPAYHQLQPDQAMISLSLSHSGQRVGECRQLTQEELNALPPNMRKPSECPRERHPLQLRFSVDDEVRYQRELRPTGIWDDGAATVYARIPVSSGSHRLEISMNDSGGTADDYQRQMELELQPGQHLVIEFDELAGAFRLTPLDTVAAGVQP
jgi:hypothetical protein